MAQPFNPGRWILTALFLGLVGGFIWAALETGKARQWLSSAKELAKEKIQEKPDMASVPPEKKPEIEIKNPVVQKPDKPPEVLKPAGPPKMPDSQMKGLLDLLMTKIKRGDLDYIRKEMAAVDRARIPEAFVDSWNMLATRLHLYYRLISETNTGRISSSPKVYILKFSESRELVVKTLTRDDTHYYFETLTGIGTAVPKGMVSGTPTLVSQGEAVARIEDVLIEKCSSRNIVVEEQNNLIKGFRDSSKRAPAAMDYFDMADFCVENGLNGWITTLFDEAIRREPNLAQTAHEEKARRQLALWEMLIKNKVTDDAREVYEKLGERYTDTLAYRNNLDKFRREYGPQAREIPVEPTPEVKKTADSPVVEVPVPKLDPQVGPATPDSIRVHVDKGDSFYGKGIKNLADYNNSNDNTLIRKALQQFTAAYQEYEIAQDMYEALGQRIPQDLLDKVRETNMYRSMCRKMSISGK